MEQLIINALKKSCGNKNIKFQVIIQDEELHIYANHRQNYHPQYSVLEENVAGAIASLNLDTVDTIWLYARPLGQTEPNWQVFVELPTQISGGREKDTEGKQKYLAALDPLDDLPNLDSLIDVEEQGDYDPTILSSIGNTEKIQNDLLYDHEIEAIEQDFAEEIEFTDFLESSKVSNSSLGDTGLLHETGFFHGSPLKEAEIDTLFHSLNPSQADGNVPAPYHTRGQYCFITNQKLLTEPTDPPGKDTMRMVKFFHHLSEGDRQQLLPILESYFSQSTTPGLDTALPAVQDWVQKIRELDEANHHLLAVWLSRYCFNPEATLEEFKEITAALAAESNNKKRTESSTEYRYVNTERQSYFSSAKDDELELESAKFQLPPIVKKILLPGIWILTTIILISLSIFSQKANLVVTSREIPPICSNTIGSPEYCRLAANLVGEKTIAQTAPSLFPLTEVTEEIANYGCGRYANLKAGIDIAKIPPSTTPVISTYGEKIFPHIYVIKVEQQQAQSSDKIKVGCVYTAGQGQRSPKKLAAEQIPFNWPQEHYQQQTEQNNNLFLGVYNKPIRLGLYTIFAAFGIAIASRFNLGLKIAHAYTVYLVALLLGIVQLSVSLLPAFGLLGAMILPIAIILLASFLLKDFELNWKQGYPYVAISILAIVAIQLGFYSLCLGLISGLV
ncbi:MAG: hypothetical protein AAFO95_18100, partial [Cyanobacteria bacterium J06600_6]